MENKVLEEKVDNIKEVENIKRGSKSNLSIASMILGIISLVFTFIYFISIPCSILAIVFSALSLRKGRNGMAITGLVTGILSLSIYLFLFLIGFFIGLFSVVSAI